jgi:peptide/nickel transport system permease protein
MRNAPDVNGGLIAEAGEPQAGATPSTWSRLTKNWSVRIGGGTLMLLALMSLTAPWLSATDPRLIDPVNRDLLPGATAGVVLPGIDGGGGRVQHTFVMGTDSFGRDIYARVLYGGRVSLVVGASVALLSVLVGVVFGLAIGAARWLDGVVMRVMDGVMAIPGILLAITLVALWRVSLGNVILAITFTEIPRVVRLVRSLVLSIREEPYVEAAVSAGTPALTRLYRHILPNTVAPLIVQGTYICAFAMLLEATLSFLGVGLPPEVPTWGNIMAEGRQVFSLFPHNIIYPGVCLALTILAVNVLGDGLRDTLDPKMAKRV